jgi:uncharacterized protein YgbK (DUF1537 family)
MNNALLGCIADDFTGATDLANNLVRNGWRVMQTMGVPDTPLTETVDAVVVALKSRTIAADQAVAQSLQALRWLQAQGAKRIYFKYCSTFDSTPQGNIGPVTDALMEALQTPFTVACPAFPDNGRTVFKGHLFVDDELLHESGMRHHPLTPMSDANLVRVLQAQTRRRVGLIEHRTVAQGPAAVAQRIATLQAEGTSIAVVDAITNDDLHLLGPALSGLALLTAGSGLALGLYPTNQATTDRQQAARLPVARGWQAVVSGSCSTATQTQVRHFLAQGGQGFAIDPLRLARGEAVVSEALAWAQGHLAQGTVLVYATAEPGAVQAVQTELGTQTAGTLVEQALAAIACGLLERGVGQLVVAGGETSGACVQALGISRMRIGPQIAPGVPWCHAQPSMAPQGGLHIALKSGNFGAPDLFSRAFDVIG